MNDLSLKHLQTGHWQQQLSQSITDIDSLLRVLELERSQLSASPQAARDFSLRVPHAFVARMEKGNPADPLLRQVLPVTAELSGNPAFVADPLDEAACNPMPGLVHKYASRVLLIVSPACAINCRYCFRRHFDYLQNTPGKKQWRPVLDYIAAHTQINEVIFSGGDPLAANDSFLHWLSDQIAEIPHVTRLRVHSRLPVMIPARINASLLNWLTGTRLKPVMVLHINHANEIDSEVGQAVQQLNDAGVTTLNQAVLLRGVNDNLHAQTNLSESLFAIGVLPYYLHLLDPVQGAAHFEVPESQAKQLYSDMQASLPGFLVPKLVREVPGKKSKSIICA